MEQTGPSSVVYLFLGNNVKFPNFVLTTEGNPMVEDNAVIKDPIEPIKAEPTICQLWDFHKCKLCPYKTKSHHLIRSHLKRHKVTRNSKIFNCMTCNIEMYRCAICTYRSTLLMNLNKHVMTTHRVGANDSNLGELKVNWKNLTRNYDCEKCSFKTFSQLLYVVHCRKCPVRNFLRANANIEKQRQNAIAERLQRLSDTQRKYNVVEISDSEEEEEPPPSPPLSSLDADRFKLKNKLINNRRYYFCDKCSYRSSSVKAVLHHKCEMKLLRCEHCPFSTVSELSLRNHKARIKHNKSLNCKICDFTTDQSHHLSEHIQQAHILPKEKKESEKPRTVVSEEKKESEKPRNVVFEEKKESKKSRNVITEEKKESSETSNKIQGLKLKTKIIKNKKFYYCEKCPYRAKYWKLVAKHKCSEKLLHCVDCSYSTLFRRNLKNHIKRHQDVYGCSMCSFSANKVELLLSHVDRKHALDEQKIKDTSDTFKCDSCEFQTKVDDELKEHILKKHVSEETVVCYRCLLCQYKTTEKEELMEHVLGKHVDTQNTNWFPCEMCPYKFKQRDDLKKHIFANHIL